MILCANRWQWPPVRAVTRSPVDDDVLVGVDRAHVAHVAEQVVVRDDGPAADELGHRRDEPHAVADDPLQDRRLGERAPDELGRRRQLRDVLGVAEPVGDHPRRDDHRVVGAERLVVHVLEALVDLERHLPLVAGERQPLLAPEAREEVDLGALLREAALRSTRSPARSSRPPSGRRPSCPRGSWPLRAHPRRDGRAMQAVGGLDRSRRSARRSSRSRRGSCPTAPPASRSRRRRAGPRSRGRAARGRPRRARRGPCGTSRPGGGTSRPCA